MTSADGWICRVCWKWNRPQDEACYKCKTVRGVTEEQAAEAVKALAARAEDPEPVPDIVVALPVVIIRSYGKVWFRGGIGLLGVLALEVFAAVTDVIWYVLTVGFAVGLIVNGFVAGEVSEGMRNREVWAYLVGIVMSVVAVIGSHHRLLRPGAGPRQPERHPMGEPGRLRRCRRGCGGGPLPGAHPQGSGVRCSRAQGRARLVKALSRGVPYRRDA